MKKIFFATASFVCFFQTLAFCQTDSTVIKNAVSKLRTLLTDHITEKAYLHLDRQYPFYVAGESVYFKAYVVKGERHELSNISGMLHVDLINNKTNTVIQSELVQLNYGLGWGDIKLADTLQKGSYQIRAYTEWMRNEKEPNFFEEYLSVSSFNNVDRVGVSSRNLQPVVQFFPEGGNLVADVRTKVGVKGLGNNGLGLDFKGTVTDDQNKEVAQISSTHLGMGIFSMVPEQGRKYKAKIMFTNGTQGVFNLPAIEEKGITLAVNTDDPSKVSIEIKANRAYYKENLNKQLNLLIYWGGAMRTVNTKLDNEVLGLDLPANTFRTGVLKISLLSQTGEPLNERLVFIQNADQLNLTISTNKKEFAKREAVNLNLNAQKDGANVNGFFSVSVLDESKIQVDETAEQTIMTNLLMTSELKGYVEKPNYYFAAVNKETRANLDVLMLTQGFRRFEWKQLLNEDMNAALPYRPEQYLDISGTLKSKTGVPLADAKVILLPLGQTEKTDQQGHFIFAKVNFQSGTQFVLKATSSAGKTATILDLDKPGSAPAVAPANPALGNYNGSADILASYQNNPSQGVVTANNSAALSNLKTSGVKRFDNYRSSNLSGPGHADQVISGDVVKNSPLLSTGLNGVAHGIDFLQGVPLVRGSEVIGGASSGQAMMVVVDGTVLRQGSSIDDISPGSVETVEVLKGSNATIYGENSNTGVLVITTRQGGPINGSASKETAPGVFAITPAGFYKAREFYAPAYLNAQNTGTDLRTTIFWKPDVNTDATGNASLRYFNADGAGTYRVVVEGIDAAGNLGRQVFTYKVQ